LRIMLNISIFDFELTDEEMKQIAVLDTGHCYENW
jgi:diketogulonate reductase-like aldo/keto reductase